MKVTKTKNSMNFEEYQIFDRNVMNSLMGQDRDSLVSYYKSAAGGFIESIDKKFKLCNTFSLFEDEIERYVNQERAKKMANGWLANIKRMCYPNHDIKYIQNVEGPLKKLHPEDFPHIKFKYLDEEKVDNVTCLDINSSYLSILAKGIFPDLDSKRELGIVEEDEIGFIDGFGTLQMVEPGFFANIIFKKKYNKDLEKWSKDKYGQLQRFKAQNKVEEALEYKSAIVRFIGSIRNHNPYFYVYIIHTAKQKIVELLDENCIHCNTDSIFFKGKRPDIKNISNKLGDFKVEFEDCILIRPNLTSNYIAIKDGVIVKSALGGFKKEAFEGYNEQTGLIFRTPKYKEIGGQIYEV